MAMKFNPLTGQLDVVNDPSTDTLHVLKSGDTMTGDLTMSSANIALSSNKGLSWAGGSQLYEQTSTQRMIYQPNGDRFEVLTENGSAFIAGFHGAASSLPNSTRLYNAVGIGNAAGYAQSGTLPTNGLVVSGNVGLNITAPTYRLDIRGTAAADGVRSAMGFDIYAVPAPTFNNSNVALAAGGTNLGIGVYTYTCTYVTALGETSSSAGTGGVVTTDASNRKVTVTVPVSTDPRVTGRKIYRTLVGGAIFQTHLLTTINDNTTTTYLDDIADATISSAATDYFRSNTTSKNLSYNGVQILDVSPSVEGNIFVGYLVGNQTATSGRNVFVGRQIGTTLTSGNSNVALGKSTLATVTTGASNNAVGYLAGAGINTGSNNNLFGLDVMYQNNGSANTAMGHFAGFNNVSGSNNVFLGAYAGQYETGSSKLFIDNQTRTNEATARTNALMYGVFNATPANQTLAINAVATTLGLNVSDNHLNISTSKTPASATDTGTTGDIAWDANYIYVCTATNTWVRTALTTW